MIPISLSPSKLNLFRECPRCFHDSYASDTPRPRGIMASLPGGMDLIMKNYMDQFRGKLPPALDGQIPGVLLDDMTTMKRWRFWKTGPCYKDTKNMITLVGALDDCLVSGKVYIPLDWKAKGSEPKDDGSQYYQTQLDCYNLMIEAMGKEVRDEGWLVYLYPAIAEDSARPNLVNVTFALKPFKLTCSRERAKEIILRAAECLRGPRPEPAATCEHCNHIQNLKLLEEIQSQGVSSGKS